jgi:outer membrane protein assembly factor BamE (lipoprotein component of BamABCDE complex)
MKKTFLLSVGVSTALLAFPGCSTTDQSGADKPKEEKKAETKKDDRPIEQKIKVGMPKEEVQTALGDPSGKSVNSDGEESWSYSDHAKAWIPYYSLSGGKFHTTVINFDKDGKVKSWSTNAQGAY